MPIAPIPWPGFQPATMHYNEAPVGGLVVYPFNAWTNIAYLAVSAWLLLRYTAKDRDGYSAVFALIAAAVGLTSFLYHASGSFFFQVFDLAAMYLLSTFLIALDFRRLFRWSARQAAAAAVPVFLVQTGLLLLLRGSSGAVIFGVAILAVVALEMILSFRETPAPDRRPFWITLGLLAVSFGFWLQDVFGLWIDPGNHFFQGHGAWHIVNSLCFISLYRFYRQFGLRGRSA